MHSLPTGDHTPPDYQLPNAGFVEVIKRPLRRVAYPAYNWLNHLWLSHRYATADFQPDLWLWGQRGNDYERHRRRVSRFLTVRGRDILVAGCGTARDMESWVRLSPRRLVGVDWFSYERAWSLWKDRLGQSAPGVEVHFAQADLAEMREFPDNTFDIVGSDAVFEHLRNFREVLCEFYRILRPGGIVYATFGPLWYGWGGDHVSGYDQVTSGYNHLILEGNEYRSYLDGMGGYCHSEHDGRTWIEHDLFSRLTAREYLRILEEAEFRRLFVAAGIEPQAVACLRHPQFNKALLERFDHLDLLIYGMTIIYERQGQSSNSRACVR